MRTSFVASTLLYLASFATAQTQPQLNLMPMPASVQPGAGLLPITQSFSVAVTGAHDASLDEEVQRFQAQLARQTGIPFRPKPGAVATLQIHADHARQAVQKLGEDEAYELTVTESSANLTAPTTLGVERGLQTFLQLVEITPAGFAVPPSLSKILRAFPGAAPSSTSAATSFPSTCSSATSTRWPQ